MRGHYKAKKLKKEVKRTMQVSTMIRVFKVPADDLQPKVYQGKSQEATAWLQQT